jgi:hypothetical protein
MATKILPIAKESILKGARTGDFRPICINQTFLGQRIRTLSDFVFFSKICQDIRIFDHYTLDQ